MDRMRRPRVEVPARGQQPPGPPPGGGVRLHVPQALGDEVPIISKSTTIVFVVVPRIHCWRNQLDDVRAPSDVDETIRFLPVDVVERPRLYGEALDPRPELGERLRQLPAEGRPEVPQRVIRGEEKRRRESVPLARGAHVSRPLVIRRRRRRRRMVE